MAQVSSSAINLDLFLYRENPWTQSVKAEEITYRVHINTWLIPNWMPLRLEKMTSSEIFLCLRDSLLHLWCFLKGDKARFTGSLQFFLQKRTFLRLHQQTENVTCPWLLLACIRVDSLLLCRATRTFQDSCRAHMLVRWHSLFFLNLNLYEKAATSQGNAWIALYSRNTVRFDTP